MKVIEIPVVVMFRVHDDTVEAAVLHTVEAAFEHSTIGEALREAITKAPWAITDEATQDGEDDEDDYFGYAFGRWPMRSDPL